MDEPFLFTASKRQDRQGAASRQKSCNACVRGKRRCDKTLPRCTRCAAKGLECVYAKLPPGAPATSTSSPTEEEEESSMSSAATHVDDYSMGGAFEMPSTYDMHLDAAAACGGPSTSASSTQAGTLELDPSLDFNIADLIQGNTGDWSLPPFLEEPKMNFPVPTMFQPAPPPAPEPIRDIMILRNGIARDECLSADPLLVHDKRTVVGFVHDWVRGMPDVFARTRLLPFIHPRLYAGSLPRPMMAAFGACAAYSGRTEATRPWVLKLVADTAREILHEGKVATTPLEKMARLQAHTIVDTIRVFDGDIALRSASERERDVRKAWLMDLLQVKDELEREEGVVVGEAKRDEPPRSWESWILVESVRRTILMALAFHCLVQVLKSEMPDPDMWPNGHDFTASSHLWNAQSPVDFFRAWREKPHWWVKDFGFDAFWQYARAEDADEFTRLFLTSHVGPDTMDEFMSTKQVST